LRKPSLPPLSLNAWLRWDVVQRLLPPAGIDVLEIGCGQGGFGVRLAQRYRYVGLEPDVPSFEVAHRRLEGHGTGEVRNGDLSALGSGERFDLVCAFEVLEHIEDDRAALKDWADWLRPGGWILLSTPAQQGRFGPFDEIVGHYRRYDSADMHSLLSETGLVDTTVVHFGAPLGYALETARNVVGRRRQQRVTGSSMADRTGGSGRLLQPSSAASALVTRAGTAPFRAIQRAFPHRGTGLVARGRKPI
jgi:SAM-dependent methyltransferase